MFSTFLSLGALLPLVSAAVHDIHVGQDGLTFTPEVVTGPPGDQLVFHFHPKNHSVTQSTFADPCGPKPGGVDSGFMPVADNNAPSPTFTVTINDTNPFWVYCKQAAKTPQSHCGQGMVFAYNCGPDGSPTSFTNFKKAALAVGASLQAGAGSSAAASSTWTAAYGTYTVPPPPTPSDVTQTITLESSTWVTSYSSYPNSPAPTPAALAGTVHKVYVGGPGKLVYDPPHISAQPRDIVMFEFRQKNHTVTQSSFDDPCRMLKGGGGFDSGFQPVADNAATFPTWNITVNDTAPIWAYCRQKTPVSHCGSGMVFAINSDESGDRNFTAFQSLAKMLNGTSALSTSSPSPSNGAASLRVGGTLALGLGAIVACML
jgi:plastocyanin